MLDFSLATTVALNFQGQNLAVYGATPKQSKMVKNASNID
jgi:hypothetical protein